MTFEIVLQFHLAKINKVTPFSRGVRVGYPSFPHIIPLFHTCQLQKEPRGVYFDYNHHNQKKKEISFLIEKKKKEKKSHATKIREKIQKNSKKKIHPDDSQ